ncbi:nucleotidyltransferase [Caballeronia sp. GACF4]|uniref:SMODS domain-containing nucleotidyltransferase n=2 Tax=unclassified Caballeronia TaxID=2646786 RepID=UPI002028FCDE|nr:nucleotidyltransferase [Caballeronia sp. GACF4]
MSVISYLDGRANQAVLSALEEASINISIQTIGNRLTSYFGTNISKQFRFGSSTRATILPRSMDEHSDIDYMVVFSDSGYTPQTYLDRLKRFADFHYSSSDIKQSSPSIVLQLNHIKFDLVPALSRYPWGGFQIPNGPNLWQDTDPYDFNATITAKNAAEHYRFKPAVRLLKFWNATNGYVFDSFSLEKYAAGLNYYGAYNVAGYLYTMINNLGVGYMEAQWRKDRVERAKQLVTSVRQYEAAGLYQVAETEVKKIIPE